MVKLYNSSTYGVILLLATSMPHTMVDGASVVHAKTDSLFTHYTCQNNSVMHT
jgi:hypothetical protein